MNAQINSLHSDFKRQQMRREAENSRRRTASPAPSRVSATDAIVRLAGPEDAVVLAELAELGVGSVPSGETLIAVEDEQVRAALPVGPGQALRDPVRPTLGAVVLLHRARTHLRDGERTRPARRFSSASGRLRRLAPAGR